jgi:hypothetical protein
MVLQYVTQLPEDTISHQAAERSHKITLPKPINGLEVSFACMPCPGVDVFAWPTVRRELLVV